MSELKIRVVNVWKEPCDVYVGRGSRAGNGYGRSVLGNPHNIEKYGECKTCGKLHKQGEAVDEYLKWLRIEYGKGRGPVYEEIHRLLSLARLCTFVVKPARELTLGCTCHPQACHADVIRDALLKIDDYENERMKGDA